VSVTVGGCREITCSLLPVVDVVEVASAVIKTSARVCKSTGVSQGGNPHLESQQTLKYHAHPRRNGLPLVVAGGGWSRARPPLSTSTLTLSWTHLAVLLK